MQGFMRQRGSSWELRVYLGRDEVTGKKRYATKTVRGGKREAQSALAAMVAEADSGVGARTGGTVGELLERWFEHAAPDFSPKTVLETRGVLDRYLLHLRTTGGRSGRPLSPGTIRRVHGILRRALTQGVRWGWLGSNPASAATPPRVPAAEIKPPDPSALARVFALAQESDPELATFIVLAAATGARRSELLALRWADIDFDLGAITIGRAMVMSIDGLVEKDTKTHSVRRISIDPTSLATLRSHRVRAEERAAACGVSVATTAFVFTHDVAGLQPWYPDSTSRAFRRLCASAGLSGIRLHDLRHYVATRLLSSGVDVRTVAGRLGHRNASTTLNVYSHFLPEADRDAANVLGRIFDDAVEAGTSDPGVTP